MPSKHTPTDPSSENAVPRRNRLLFYSMLASLVAATLVAAALTTHWWAARPDTETDTVSGEQAKGNEFPQEPPKQVARSSKLELAKEKELPPDLPKQATHPARLELVKGDEQLRKLPKQVTHPCGLELVLIPPGKFLMGPPPEEQGRRLPPPGRKQIPIIDPQVPVTIAEPFYLGVYEVTQEQYERVMGVNPSLVRGPSQPVERVTWEDALRFCRKLGEQDGHTYRLPTTTEWEYVCRAGTTTPFHSGTKLSSAQANFDSDFPSKWSAGGPNRRKPLPVGTLPANAWGLHDMHGNVSEWCLDLCPSREGFYHYVCGGGWNNNAEWCRSAMRWGQLSTTSSAIGFRVLRTTTPELQWRLGPEPGKGRPADTVAWLRARIDEALAKPTAPLLPGVLIFPPVYAKKPETNKWFKGLSETRIIAALPYSLAASMAVAYGPQRRMALSPQLVFEVFQNEKFDSQRDGILTDAVIDRCLERLGCRLYVVAREANVNGKIRLIVELHGDADHPDQTRTHEIPVNTRSHIPGWIALDVLDWLGVKPGVEETARLREPLCQGASTPYELGELMKAKSLSLSEDQKFQEFLKKDSSPAAWHAYLNKASVKTVALDQYEKARRGLPCDMLKLPCAAILRESGRLREAIDLLLELAPTHRGDPYYHAQLLNFGLATGEDRLVDHLLRKWEEYDSSLFGSLERGRFLIRWAWRARGGGFAGTVTEEGAGIFHKRLEGARRELETIAQKERKVPGPHVSLITVAMGLGLPREYADKHYRAALAAYPGHAPAYRTYFNYLMPRWHGRPEDMLAFARECVKSGLWEDGVPDLFLTAVKDMAFDGDTGIYHREVFRNPVVWDGLKDYFEQTRKMQMRTPRLAEPWALYNARICSYYLLWGSYCGKRAELENALADITYPDLAVFSDSVSFYHIRDQIRSETGKGVERFVAKARVALAAGDFDEAERILGRDADWPSDATPERERLRRGAAQGRRLAREGTIKLSPRDILDGWTVWGEKRWRVEGKNLVCTMPAGEVAFVQCPFPLGSATVKGLLECRGNLNSAQIVLHAQCAMDPLRVQFLTGPHADAVSLTRNNIRLDIRPTTLGIQKFRIDIGPKHDRIVLNDQQPGMLTELPSFMPGGIGFEAYAHLKEGEFVLGPLEITTRPH